MADGGKDTPPGRALDPRRPARPLDESLLRSGLVGIGAVGLATLALLVAGTLIALVVSLVF